MAINFRNPFRNLFRRSDSGEVVVDTPEQRTPRRRFSTFTRALIVILFVLGVVAFFVFPSKKPEEEQITQPTAQPIDVTEYTVGKQYQTLTSVNGTASLLSSTQVVALSAGRVTYVAPLSGKNVAEGEILVKLGSGNSTRNVAEFDLASARTGVKQAQDQLSTARKVRDASVDQAEVGVENVEKALELGRTQATFQRNILNEVETSLKEAEGDLAKLPDIGEANPIQSQQIKQLKATVVELRIQANMQRSAMEQALQAFDPENPELRSAEAAKKLVEAQTKGAVSAAAIGVEAAKIMVMQAEIAADMANVRAPFAGKLDRIKVKVGDVVQPGTLVAQLAGSNEFRIYANVSADVAGRVLSGQNAKIKYNGKEVGGVVTNVDFFANPQTKLYEVEVKPDNFDGRAGSQVELSLPVGLPAGVSQENQTAIPLDALYITSNEKYVFINDNGTARRRVVSTGSIYGDAITITEGLKEGDHVIVRRELVEGQKVTVKEKVAAYAVVKVDEKESSSSATESAKD